MSVLKVAAIIGLLALAACASPPPADLVLTGGRIWTGTSPAYPSPEGEPSALAVRDGKVAAIGSDAEIARFTGSATTRVELNGRRVVPGFVDNHIHFIGGGIDLDGVQLREATTPQEFTRRVAEYALRRPGVWITGGQWDHEPWGGSLPTRAWVDGVTGDAPLLVYRLDGHMALANSRALSLAGITAKTPDPPGGVIARGPDGGPTGILKDTAIELVQRLIPPSTPEEMDRGLRAAQEHALSRGITAINDMDTWESLATIQRARRAGTLRLRVYSLVPLETWPRLAEFITGEGRGDEWHSWGALKGFVDGSLGATTAWLHEPYSDHPGISGLPISDLDTLRRDIIAADAAGLQVAVHAIGDRAVDWLIDAFVAAREANGPRDRRFRIEHCYVTSPRAVKRMAEERIVASLQPYLTDDEIRWLANRLGPEREAFTNPFQALIAAGVPVSFGSDWNVTRLDPLYGIHSATTRRDLDAAVTPPGWERRQRMTVPQAIAAYSTGNAWASFRERWVGTLEPDKAADLVVLSRDLLAEAGDLRDILVDMTMVGGQIAFERAPPAAAPK